MHTKGITQVHAKTWNRHLDSLRARRVVLNDEGCDDDHELLG
jgi:hypothetical protein